MEDRHEHPATALEPIRWRMHFASAPHVLYRALDTNGGRASFWAEQADEVDGVIHFAFINGVHERAPVTDRQRDRLFALRYFGAEVVFELDSAEDGGTDLTLTTSGFAPHERDELVAGWLNVLFPMKAAVDHGVDLRNHDPSRTWDRGWADQ